MTRYVLEYKIKFKGLKSNFRVNFQAELNLNIFVVCNAVFINSKCGQNYWLLHDNSYSLEQNKKTLKSYTKYN